MNIYSGISKKIILLNAVIFAFIYVLNTLGNTFLDGGADIISDIFEFTPRHALIRPWTFVSYMLIHYDLLHVACNMMIFHLYSKVYLQHHKESELAKIYPISGIVTAVVYFVVSYAMYVLFTLPVFFKPIIGSSSSVLFILSATTFLNYKRGINIFNLFKTNILLLSSIIFACFVLFDMDNIGGHVMHLISIISGCIYAMIWGKRRYKHMDKTKEYKNLLKKVRYSGFSSLNIEEKKLLGKYSNNSFK